MTRRRLFRQLLVESIVVATFPVPNEAAERVALAIMKSGVLGGVEFDWDEVSRLAALPDYDVAAALERFNELLQRENLK